jgi:hypothetical protein
LRIASLSNHDSATSKVVGSDLGYCGDSLLFSTADPRREQTQHQLSMISRNCDECHTPHVAEYVCEECALAFCKLQADAHCRRKASHHHRVNALPAHDQAPQAYSPPDEAHQIRANVGRLERAVSSLSKARAQLAKTHEATQMQVRAHFDEVRSLFFCSSGSSVYICFLSSPACNSLQQPAVRSHLGSLPLGQHLAPRSVPSWRPARRHYCKCSTPAPRCKRRCWRRGTRTW